MAPPLPLANVAGTLALSFTAGRAAPTSEPPIQRPTTVPSPPSQPETTAPPSSPEPTGEPDTPEPTVTAEPTGDPGTPEPMVTPPAPSEPAAPAPSPVMSAPIGPAELESPFEPSTPPVTSPRLLRSNERQYMFNLFVGTSRPLRGYLYYGGSEFKAEASIGGFNRRFRAGGFGVVQVNAGFPFNSFTFAPRLTLNRQIFPDVAFYFTTNLTVGYRLWASRIGYSSPVYYGDYYGNYGYNDSSPDRYLMHSAVLGASWGVSAIIAERLLLSFRPLDAEVVIPAPTLVQTNWSVMGGVGILWGRSSSEKKTASASPTTSRRRRRG